MQLRPGAFLETIIAFLMPWFSAAAVDQQEARSEIIDTLAAYGTRTRAELFQAAQVIALGMTTLDTLSEAKAADLSPSMRIRYRGCANGLNRSTRQTEQALDQRLAAELPAPESLGAEPLDAADPMQESLNDRPDIGFPAAVAPARQTTAHQAMKTPTARVPSADTDAEPLSEKQQERNKMLWAGAMMDTLQQLGIPVQPIPPGTSPPPSA